MGQGILVIVSTSQIIFGKSAPTTKYPTETAFLEVFLLLISVTVSGGHCTPLSLPVTRFRLTRVKNWTHDALEIPGANQVGDRKWDIAR